MSPCQKSYALARAMYDAAKSACASERAESGINARVSAAYEGDDEVAQLTVEGEIIALERTHNLDALRDVLRAAETAMIDWSISESIHLARDAAQRAEILAVPSRARRSPTLWPKLVDIAFRLHA